MAPKAKRAPSSPAKAKAAAPAGKAAEPAKAAPPTKAAVPAKAAPSGLSPEEAKRVDEEAKIAEEEKAKALAEAEAKAAEQAEAEARAAEEEKKQREAAEQELKRLAALANGEVTIRYSMYDEKFKIENHTLKAETIDELYCLSDVMPGCFIHLAEKEFAYGEEQVFVKEEPPGTFKGLMTGETYWCYVQQDPEQEKKDQEAMRQRFAGVQVGGGIGDRGTEVETCSCRWGAPCTNEAICNDWENRFANAIKAGGNPILFVGGTG